MFQSILFFERKICYKDWSSFRAFLLTHHLKSGGGNNEEQKSLAFLLTFQLWSSEASIVKFSLVDLQALCKRSLFTKITAELTLLIQFRCFLLNIIKVTTIPSGKYNRSEWSSSSSTLYWFRFPQLCYISINQQRSEFDSHPLSISIWIVQNTASFPLDCLSKLYLLPSPTHTHPSF